MRRRPSEANEWYRTAYRAPGVDLEADIDWQVWPERTCRNVPINGGNSKGLDSMGFLKVISPVRTVRGKCRGKWDYLHRGVLRCEKATTDVVVVTYRTHRGSQISPLEYSVDARWRKVRKVGSDHSTTLSVVLVDLGGHVLTGQIDFTVGGDAFKVVVAVAAKRGFDEIVLKFDLMAT